MSAASPPEVVLAVRDISKQFGAVQALGGVGLDCRAGEIHAVVGENGSGKSTLLGIASGVTAPDEGSVVISGQPLLQSDPNVARSLGLAMAYQTYSAVLELSVGENLYLAAPAGARPQRYGDVPEWAAAQLAAFDLPLDPRQQVGDLPLSLRQFFEVVKALLTEPQVLLLDEPTTALGPKEVDRLHEIVHDRAAAGIGVVYVSHRLPEVLEVAERVTVLRDGRGQGTHSADSVTEEDLVALMIGRPAAFAFEQKEPDAVRQTPVLEAAGVQGAGFGPVDLTLREGEVLGVAGAEGNGQRELLRALAGAGRAAGTLRCGQRPVRLGSPRRALAAGVLLLSGERVREALFPILGVRSNATVQVLDRFSSLGWLHPARERTAVAQVAGDLRVRTPSLDQPVRFLSGGNQQKVVMSRPFLLDAKVLIADEPTQGVDVGSRFDIYAALRAKARQGLGIIVKSSDPLELAGLCDRVVVLSRGRVVRELHADELDERTIVESIVGTGVGPDVATAQDRQAQAAGAAAASSRSRWLTRLTGGAATVGPLLLLVALMAAVGGYTTYRTPFFLTAFNLNSLLLLALPLALVSMAQLNALLVGGFDVSVGAMMSLVVVAASFLLPAGASGQQLAAGIVAIVALGVVVGLLNGAVLIRWMRLPPIIATIATLSILQGAALLLRPTPGGQIDRGFMQLVTSRVGFVPIAFGVVVVAAVGWDLWLRRTRGGAALRATGHDQTSAMRVGVRTSRIQLRAYLLSAVLAAVAGLTLAGQVGVGDSRVGLGFALTSIAAAVLGGASLTGGRGSFVGALVGALFLSLVLNIIPFLGWSSALGQVSGGALTLLALLLYSGRELLTRARGALAELRQAPVPG